MNAARNCAFPRLPVDGDGRHHVPSAITRTRLMYFGKEARKMAGGFAAQRAGTLGSACTPHETRRIIPGSRMEAN